MNGPVHVAFEERVLELPLDRLMPVRPITDRMTKAKKYVRVSTSIAEMGVIEPLAVTSADKEGRHLLVDGHLRLHALCALGAATAPCIVADDDEAFTYNKRVNRLATVQEHYMIQRAIDRGVQPAMIARALGFDERTVARRRTMLDGIAPDVVELLKDRPVNGQIFDTLRKMRPEKQFATAELMISMNNFSNVYARAMLAATKQSDLVRPAKPKAIKGVTAEQMARMERELEGLSRDFRAVEATYGDDVLHLVLASRYLARLIANPEVTAYVEKRHPEILSEFQTIVSATSLQ